MDNLFRRLILYISILCAALLPLLPICSPNAYAAESTESPQTSDLFYNELQIVYLTNLQRRAQGLAPLRWNRELSEAARWFAQDSVEQHVTTYCGHNDSNNGSPGDRLKTYKYTNATAWGENVVCGYTSPDGAVDGWMNSELHKLNILQTTYREIGVGYYRNAQSGRGYIVQDFGYDANYAPVIINNEALNTTSADVQLYIYNPAVQPGLEGMGDAIEMMVANDPSFAGASWEPFAQEKNWTLTSEEGWHTVYVKTRDGQGRTNLVSDMIYLGASVPPETYTLAQASSVEEQLAFYNLDKTGWPAVQLSVNWQGDDSDVLFEHIAGDGEEIADAEAVGGTVLKLDGTKTSHARYWTTQFYKNVDFIAYVRLKVNDNQTADEVLRLKIIGGGVEYGPLVIKGTDFAQPNVYQEFALPFTFQDNSEQPYLIFNLYGTGKSSLFIDTITVYTSAMPSQNRLEWSVLGGYYRSRGIWARFINDSTGKFSSATELIPNAESVSPNAPPPEDDSNTEPTTPLPLPYQILLPIVTR